MSGKAVLRAINDAIKQQKFDEAIEKSKGFLDKDPQNYQCHIFLAFSEDKKGNFDAAEVVYKAATALRPQEPQAWQGLVKVFEKQVTKKLGPYQDAVISLARIFHDADDLYKAQDVVDKFVDHARVHGDKVQYADALWIQLPESPLYSILEGRFPHPGQTYERIAGILEDYEKKRTNNLIGERRTRLGAKLSQVTLEVKREVYAQSKLEHIYRQLINWTSDDDVRRQYEEKLLFYCHERMTALPLGDAKNQEREKVFGLANDMVIIKHPYKLAWDIAIDWQDNKDIKDYDVDVLRAYCVFFPETDLYKAITAFLTSTLSPFPPPVKEETEKAPAIASSDESSEDDDDGGAPTFVVPLTDEDRLVMMTEAATTFTSTFGFRLAGQLFLNLGEYENTVEFMRKAHEIHAKVSAKTGLDLIHTEDSYRLSLGTALVYYQSPRHHVEAKELFEKVLEHDQSCNAALIGVGLIYEEEEEFDDAIEFLARALQRDATNVKVRSEAAWVRALKGDWEQAKEELQQCMSFLDIKNPPKELLAETQYRLGFCIWNLDTSKEARKQRKGECAYAYWLAALNNNLNHAPTYTSLGLYYSGYANDKKRSRRCFQKALELSSSEVVAAEQLARSFADDGDWDRVELVAQRIIDSGKVKPPPGSKRKGISWPFAALGVAELNKQDFHKSIVSFQAALRLSPNDYHSWVGLGEAYHSSGRYVAATKAIMNAQELEEGSEVDISGDTWFTKYMLANIKRELGEFDESIALYQAVMETHPDEEGVTLALMHTKVDNALTSVEKGLYGKSIQLAIDTLKFATTTNDNVLETFNFWKSVGDACSVFISVQSHASKFPLESVKQLVEKISTEAQGIFIDVDQVNCEAILSNNVASEDSSHAGNLNACIHAMILFYKQAIHVSASDRNAQAVGYYNLGWAEHRAHSCLAMGVPSKSKSLSSYLKAAVRAFKRAIELEAGNADFWNALGVVTSSVNPSVSQHAFVRSLHLNERSPVPWTNLGTLALLSGDMKLANEAFTRAQSTDPDYAHAWLGQSFVALMYGETKQARGLFTHAMGIAEASSLSARQHYASSIFDHILTGPPGLNVATLIQPLFALNQVCTMQSQSLTFGHLASLFQERTGEHLSAVKTLEKISSTLEADYEDTEAADTLARFTLAKTDLARAYLAAGSYSEAAECGEMALGLSSDETDSELSREQRRKARLSAHLTVGLAKYYAGEFDEALGYFETALEESDGNPDAVCLLTQVLWAQGSEQSRERARDALFKVIEKAPNHVQSILLLGVIALLDKDEDSLEAVVEELQTLRTNDAVSAIEQSNISQVLHAISTEKTPADTTNLVQIDVMLYPNLPHGWSSLAEVADDQYAAQMALYVAIRGIPPRGDLEGHDLAKAYMGTGKVSDAQKAVVLAPWEMDGWTALSATTEGI